MGIIDKVLSRKEFQDKPPVLIDIGASGRLPEIWQALRKHSICIAFDADSREMGQVQCDSKHYKKLYIYPRILISSSESEAVFYLTKSPYCSSLLRPLNQKLRQWAFADLFELDEQVTLKAVNLQTVLTELNLDWVDWFKTDSQGTDLRLFKSLGHDIIKKVLVADFEPGIIDVYEGEDKLWQLMSFMEQYGFWMSDFNVEGSQRIQTDFLKYFNRFERKYIHYFIKTSPGWAEISYVNDLNEDHKDYNFTQRDLLLAWVCCYIKEQHGESIKIAHIGYQKFADNIFLNLRDAAIHAIKRSNIKLPAYFARRLCQKISKSITQKLHEFFPNLKITQNHP